MEHKTYFWLVLLLTFANNAIIGDGRATGLSTCARPGTSSNILQLLNEQKVVESFVKPSSYTGIQNLPNRFETSDAVISRDGKVIYLVFDNSYHIAALCTPLGRASNCTDRLLPWPDSSLATKASSFEGLAYDQISNTYFVVQEALKTDVKKVFRGNVFEIRIDTKDSTPIQVLESCMVNWVFTSENKGFEGLEFVRHSISGRSYLLGLCEANDCNRDSTFDNHGRILVLEKKSATKTKSCSWEPVGTLNLPSWVHFADYSAVSIYNQDQTGSPARITVTSQENSQIWVGRIEEIDQAPFFKLSSPSNNGVHDLPQVNTGGQKCEMQYCNIEGVAWQDENHLVLVSDQVKSDQAVPCIPKDQSVHYFSFPDSLLK